jgi:hypothetical protein
MRLIDIFKRGAYLGLVLARVRFMITDIVRWVYRDISFAGALLGGYYI